jgi:anti-anti-sigma factor
MTNQTLTLNAQNLEEQAIVMLKVDGPLDSQTYSTLESKLDRLINHGETKIIIDLAGVNYVTLAGVRVFVSARMKAARENGSVVLMSLTEPVAHVIELLQIREILSIAKDLPEAVKLMAN